MPDTARDMARLLGRRTAGRRLRVRGSTRQSLAAVPLSESDRGPDGFPLHPLQRSASWQAFRPLSRETSGRITRGPACCDPHTRRHARKHGADTVLLAGDTFDRKRRRRKSCAKRLRRCGTSRRRSAGSSCRATTISCRRPSCGAPLPRSARQCHSRDQARSRSSSIGCDAPAGTLQHSPPGARPHGVDGRRGDARRHAAHRSGAWGGPEISLRKAARPTCWRSTAPSARDSTYLALGDWHGSLAIDERTHY